MMTPDEQQQQLFEIKGMLEKLKKSDCEVSFVCDPDGKVPKLGFDYHFHKYWELKFNVNPPQVWFHPPGTVHCATHPDLMIFLDYREWWVADWRLDFARAGFQYNQLPELLNIMQNLPLTPEYDSIRKAMAAAVIEFCITLLDKIPEQSAPGYPRYFSITKRAMDFIEQNYYRNNLSVNDVAQHLNLSAQTVNSTLRREIGLSIRQSIIRTRLEKAASLLKSKKYLIKDISVLTGWKSPYYFSNSFRRHFGVSPEQYAARMQKESGFKTLNPNPVQV